MYCPIARISCPARRKYAESTSRSACGNKSASLSTWRTKSGSGRMTLSGVRLCVEGRRVSCCLLPLASASGLVEKGAGVVMSVWERFNRFGGARGPPGTDGLATILTGRGVDCGCCGCCRFVSTCPYFPLLPFSEFEGERAVMPGFSRRPDTLPLRPSDAKKPPFGALDGEEGTKERRDASVLLLAFDEDPGIRCGRCGMASDG